MNPEQQKALWKIRFLKILQLEEEASEFYERVLKEKGKLLQKHGIKSVLEQILRDERRHIRIAKELVRMAS